MNTHRMLINCTHAAGGIGFWLALAIAAAMAYGVYTTLSDALNLPIVRRSTSTGECVAVIPKDSATCETLPRRYSLEWVE